MTNLNLHLKNLKNGLIVSSQAVSGEPLSKPEHICAMALSALNGGAKGIRLEGADNISLVRKHSKVPIIGLTKLDNISKNEALKTVYITPTFADAKLISQAGADIIALDATNRPRPNNETLSQIIKSIHNELGKLVWADISTLEEGVRAEKAGADIISTTLSGYTDETYVAPESAPDFKLLEELVKNLQVPIVLEGRVWHPEEVSKAFKIGAYAVVVGSAITRPQIITKRFVDAILTTSKEH
jgi:putative N-acetylmannosamine-6-phosphate epimerase